MKQDELKDEILINEKESQESKKSIYELLEEKVNIMLVGATGSGKSSTINALFNMEVAKVGVGVDSETKDITSYTLDNLIIWDTPGLGEGVTRDMVYTEMLTRKLSELDENGDPLIDLVLIVLDSSSKDLGTSYDLISNVIIPCLGDDKDGRILIGLNQADIAMKGKHWDVEKERTG